MVFVLRTTQAVNSFIDWHWGSTRNSRIKDWHFRRSARGRRPVSAKVAHMSKVPMMLTVAKYQPEISGRHLTRNLEAWEAYCRWVFHGPRRYGGNRSWRWPACNPAPVHRQNGKGPKSCISRNRAKRDGLCRIPRRVEGVERTKSVQGGSERDCHEAITCGSILGLWLEVTAGSL